MATDAEIATLRRMTALTDQDETYTDSLLGGLIDDLGFNSAAAQVWKERAAGAAGLVDITESGSSRSLSQLAKSYLSMASAITPAEEPTTTGRSFTVGVDRV